MYFFHINNTGKSYSYSDSCKNKPSVSFALTMNEADFPPLSPPIHAPKFNHSTFSKNCNYDLCETHGSNCISFTNELASTKIVCKPVRNLSSNKPVIFSPIYKSPLSSNIFISETVCCIVNCKPVSALISSEPVKSFITCKPVCFSNITMAK